MAALRDEVCVFQPVWKPACWTLRAVGAASSPESALEQRRQTHARVTGAKRT